MCHRCGLFRWFALLHGARLCPACLLVQMHTCPCNRSDCPAKN